MYKDGKLIEVRPRPNPLNTIMFMEIITALFKEDELYNFINTDRDELIMYHMSLGRWIRNNYIYGKNYDNFMKDYEFEHPDDISFEIIEKTWDMCHSLINDGEDIEKFLIKD